MEFRLNIISADLTIYIGDKNVYVEDGPVNRRLIVEYRLEFRFDQILANLTIHKAFFCLQLNWLKCSKLVPSTLKLLAG